jgi:hypothetical protein
VLITPDPKDPDYYRASGRDLLRALAPHNIGSVDRAPGGVAFHREFADEVRAALTTAGYQIIDGTPRTGPATPTPPRGHTSWNHAHYVADEDNLTILLPTKDGRWAWPTPDKYGRYRITTGHWVDESPTCPRCNPDHAPLAAVHRGGIIDQVRADMRRIQQRSAAVTSSDPLAGLTPQQRAARLSSDFRHANPGLFTPSVDPDSAPEATR